LLQIGRNKVDYTVDNVIRKMEAFVLFVCLHQRLAGEGILYSDVHPSVRDHILKVCQHDIFKPLVGTAPNL